MRKLLLITFIAYGTIGLSQLSTQEKIHEVYGTEFFVDKEDGYNFWVNLLENRISFSEESISPNEKYEKISEAGLANKLNSSISPFNPEEFTLESFNPLHYQLDFYQSTLTKVYRLDGTNYLLIIQPQ